VSQFERTLVNETLTLPVPTPYDIREKLTDMVINDLLGPAGGPEEELHYQEDRVRERYLVGGLAPREEGEEGVPAEQLDGLGTSEPDDAETGAADTMAPAQTSMVPSSIGLSFVVRKSERELWIMADWGRYTRITSETQKDYKGAPARVWKRQPVMGERLTVELREGTFKRLIPHPDYPDVVVQGKVRDSSIGWVVSVFLVNKQPSRKHSIDAMWVFQPQLRVTSASEQPQPVFVQRHNRTLDLTYMDPLTRAETESLDMLYRHRLDFAVGHGTSAQVLSCPDDSDCALAIESTFAPQHELPRQTPPTPRDVPELENLTLDMKQLAEMPKDELVANLHVIVEAYGAWLEREAAKQTDPKEKLENHQSAAQRAVEACARALKRIHEGIALLETHSHAERAFRFANRAMYLQRVHSIFARKARGQELTTSDGLSAVDTPENRSWRLFQLAFILLNLPSLSDLHHPDRSDETEAVADLLWFATGGGKTEAYLGLTAYTLAFRRLQGDVEGRSGEHGVAVLMRYTLRLLTLQQFQRAAALMCACEVIRREDPGVWGQTPFRLGLWVGRKATPNTLEQASESLQAANMGGKPAAGGSPQQLTSCPWCGGDVRTTVYKAPNDVGRCVTYCSDALGRCAFTEAKAHKEGLPVMVVDEEIYRHPPSLLIATVDKFAQMPWKGQVQMLFGMVNGLCPRHGFLSPEVDDSQSHPAKSGLPRVHSESHGLLRPPDLIIQDELHLISGPLGSMVGLYEAAVDELCSWEVGGKRVRPKVIASTATIRRAADQVQKLFVRRLEVFPPQGTDIRDSFFAIERPVSDDSPGRRYIGVCAFGRRFTDALIRVYIAFLAASQKLYDDYDQLADPYLTLVGYFNSIRELAGAKRLTEDEIRARLRDAESRGLARRTLRLGSIEELTARRSGTEIPIILSRLEVPFSKAQEKAREDARKEPEKGARDRKKSLPPAPYDVVLATNMISVGVDIERLGLMVVAGQPKNTSEYIQATSRVGRNTNAPGVVFTLYNWARPRDLSHFENFQHYHDTFYKHVEALSVTPYSIRALDRGLSGVFIGLSRLLGERLNANAGAGLLNDDEPLLDAVMAAIAKRAEQATGDSRVKADVASMLQRRRDSWLNLARRGQDARLEYQASGNNTVGLLKSPGELDDYLFTCLNSLRDVEATSSLVLDENAYGLNLDYSEGL
jgi:hypothetical protein